MDQLQLEESKHSLDPFLREINPFADSIHPTQNHGFDKKNLSSNLQKTYDEVNQDHENSPNSGEEKTLSKETKQYHNGTYVGEFVNGIRSGFGVFVQNDGSKYEGNWAFDLPHGFGRQNYINGDKYEGQFFTGKRSGNGTYFYSNKDIYTGSFKDDNFEGKGTYLCESGSKIEGNWDPKGKNKGIIYYPNGDRFEGEFINGMRHGEGVYHCEDGTEIKGKWKSDKKESKMLIKNPNGKKAKKIEKNGKIVDANMCKLF